MGGVGGFKLLVAKLLLLLRPRVPWDTEMAEHGNFLMEQGIFSTFPNRDSQSLFLQNQPI